MKWTDSLHAGANSGNLKVISLGQKWVWPFSSWDRKICWMNMNSSDFLHVDCDTIIFGEANIVPCTVYV